MNVTVFRPLFPLLALPLLLMGAWFAGPATSEAAAARAKTGAIQKTAPANLAKNGSNNKSVKKTAGKTKKSATSKNKKKNKHHDKKGKRGKARSGSGGGSGGLISQIRRDESRLEKDLNRLRRLLK